MTKIHTLLKQYQTVTNQLNILRNYYHIKYKNTMDYKRLALSEEIDYLKSKRQTILRKLINEAKSI